MSDHPSALSDRDFEVPKPRNRIGAIDIGLRLLNVLAAAPGPMALKDIAAATDMPAAKVHRYLVTFAAAQMVVQQGRSGRYDLGPMALRLGVAAIRRNDMIALASDRLGGLRDAVQATCFVSGWSDRGPLVLRWENSLRPVTVIVEVGSVLPLLTSATGRAFLTYLPAHRTENLAHAEGAEYGYSADVTAAETKAIADATYVTGLGRTDGAFQNGIAALAAPLFDPLRGMVGAVTALGRQEEFDADVTGPVAMGLKRFVAGLGGANDGGR